MQFHRWVEIVVISLLFLPSAHSQDLITPAITVDLGGQCTAPSGYQSCVSALHFHGLGKDDDAMDVLLANTTDRVVRERYTVAQTRLKDDFWKLVARAGAPPADCNAGLSATLTAHFGLSPKALSDAADDFAKNKYLALSDLLAVPDNAPPGWIMSAQVYRYCFDNPGHLFSVAKSKIHP
ncbi:MAG TPA: hypothetical protein VK724_03245 [Bryobacteraceae bacterium]|jgi:hypothetical protein|nr:hypothetical protein [Bryobacteraceae bacterium]